MTLINHNFSRVFFRFSEIKAKYDAKTLIIKSLCVSNPAKYVLYCLSNCPSANIFFDWTTRPCSVIDGNKRLRTLIDFIENKFPLENGMYYDDLEGYQKRRIPDYEIISYLSLENCKQITEYIQEQ